MALTPMPRYGISNGSLILGRSQANRRVELGWVKAVGARFYRIDSFPGDYARADPVVNDGIDLYGLTPLLILYGTTGVIASDSYGHDTAVHYLNRVRHYEITNEPDINGWTPNQYADFVSPTYDSVKSGDPNATVIAGAFWKGPGDTPGTGAPGFPGTLDYVQALIDRAPGKFDVLSVHPYDDPYTRGTWNMWDAMYPWDGGNYNGETIRERLDAAGMQSVPIIGTEAGGPLNESNGDPKYTQDEVKKIVANGLGQVRLGKIGSLLIFTMMNDLIAVQNFGLLDDSQVPRQGYYGFQAGAAIPGVRGRPLTAGRGLR